MLFADKVASPDRAQRQETPASTEASISCLHCNEQPALTPYVYCGPCTDEGHEIMRQVSIRNRLTQPPVKVYRWNTTKKNWMLKGTP